MMYIRRDRQGKIVAVSREPAEGDIIRTGGDPEDGAWHVGDVLPAPRVRFRSLAVAGGPQDKLRVFGLDTDGEAYLVATQGAGGGWKAGKRLSDGIGKESELALGDDIDIGVFARPKGGDEDGEKVLYLKKHRIEQPEGKISVVVDELPYDAGIDPLNKLIDRVSNDNRKRVTVES